MEKEISKKRIGELEFRPSTYICKPPENPSWEIVKYYQNPHYNKQSEYKYIGDGMYEDPKYNFHRIHKSCFKNPECCYTLGQFRYDEHEEFYEFQFCGDRPMDLSKENREPFWELLVYGNEVLNNRNEEDCE